jgi:glucokinase
MALTVLATGGIYLAGGIPRAILQVLRDGPSSPACTTRTA